MSQGPYKGKGETVDVFDGSRPPRTAPAADEPKYRDKKWLYYQYHIEGKSTRDIADEYGYGDTTIGTWLHKHDIPIKDHGEAVSAGKRSDGKHTDRDWLYSQYVTLERSLGDIAETAGVSPDTIHRELKRNGIDTRSYSEALALRNKKEGPWCSESWLRDQYIEQGKPTTQIAEEQGVSETLINTALHDHGIEVRGSGGCSPAYLSELPYTDADWLRREYVNKRRPAPDIGEECGVSSHAVYHWLDKHGIERRGVPEARDLTIIQQSKAVPVGEKKGTATSSGSQKRSVGSASYQGPSEGINAAWSDIQDRQREIKAPYRDREWLQDQYHSQNKTGVEIAEVCDVTVQTIYDWLDRHDIETRPGGPRPTGQES